MAEYVPVKLSYEVFEPKEGSDPELPPIIFIHGLTVVKELWEDVPQRLADKTKRKAFTYDERNHGESEYTDEYNLDLCVKDLFHFMDTRDIERAVLIGHLTGGQTAILAAIENSERVEMIFAEEIFPSTLPQQFTDMIIPIFELRKESLKRIPKDMNHDEAIKFMADDMMDSLPEDHLLRKMVQKEDIYKLKQLIKQKDNGEYDSVFNADAMIKSLKIPDSLKCEPEGQFDGPAYFLYTKESPLQVQSYEENIKKHFPDAELIGFDGRIHVIHLDRRDEFIDTIASRLTK